MDLIPQSNQRTGWCLTQVAGVVVVKTSALPAQSRYSTCHHAEPQVHPGIQKLETQRTEAPGRSIARSAFFNARVCVCACVCVRVCVLRIRFVIEAIPRLARYIYPSRSQDI